MSASPKKINPSAASVGSIPLTIANEVFVVAGVVAGAVGDEDAPPEAVEGAPLEGVEDEPVALVHATLEEIVKLSAKVRSAHCQRSRRQHLKRCLRTLLILTW